MTQPEHSISIQSIERHGKCIRPITISEIEDLIKQQVEMTLPFEDNIFTLNRSAERLLSSKRMDYAQLPGHGNRSANEIITGLPKNSRLLDVAAGIGELLSDIQKDVNPSIYVEGFDLKKWNNTRTDVKFTFGEVDEIEKYFPKLSFDTVTAAALFHHLPDYWGVIRRLIKIVKPGGYLLTSTIPRVNLLDYHDGLCNHRILVYRAALDNEKGELIGLDGKMVCYYRNKNVFDIHGKIVGMGEVIATLNRQNGQPSWEYSVATGKSSYISQYGGQISFYRHSLQEPGFSSLFYCHYPSLETGNDNWPLSYILARNDNEKADLKRMGFVSVDDRCG